MESPQFRLDQFEGPLDLLYTLVKTNKFNILDLPIGLLCDQYMTYIREAERLDMEIATEFLVTASDLMLIKSKMMLPRQEADEKDPRAELADALLRYQQAKEATIPLHAMYSIFSARMTKDTDEISTDRTFVADQEVSDLYAAMRRIISLNEEKPLQKLKFAPMISKPIVSVEVKIMGILRHLRTSFEETKKPTSLEELLADSTSRPDMIAIFLGVLELLKLQKILIAREESSDSILSAETTFVINDSKPDDEPITVSEFSQDGTAADNNES